METQIGGLCRSMIIGSCLQLCASRCLSGMASFLVYPVVATVPTGLERGAAEECREALGREATAHRGSITCTLESVGELVEVDRLHSIDNYRTTVKILPTFCKDEATVLERLESLPFDAELDWTASLLLWQFYTDHVAPGAVPESGCTEQRHDVPPKNEVGPADESSEKKISEDEGVSAAKEERGGAVTGPGPYHAVLKGRDITFRATCTRAGRKHCFSSQDAAKHFGAGLARYFGWKVRLKQPDVEVLLDISGDSATVSVALTQQAKFKRNIAHFGPTTLRATIAYGMLKCADIQPGDIVLDPLCGGGSISIEGSLAWPTTYHLAGDLHHLAVPRVAANVSSLLQERDQRTEVGGMKVDVCQWDVCRLPLRTASVDAVVTDMPFGKKSGSKTANRELYPKALWEMARVCRPLTARAVLLTHDHKALSRSVQRDVFWKRVKTLWVNIGGLEAALYILQRSSMPFTP